jgi:peptidoglycan/LPS O-acetylase OafA/YrhL
VLFVAAVADPANFVRLIHTGEGGGELGIICVGLAGGYALARGGRRWLRICLAVFAGLGILLMGFMVGEQYPVSTPKGAWVGVYAASLVAVFCLACAIPHRSSDGRRRSRGGQDRA